MLPWTTARFSSGVPDRVLLVVNVGSALHRRLGTVENAAWRKSALLRSAGSAQRTRRHLARCGAQLVAQLTSSHAWTVRCLTIRPACRSSVMADITAQPSG